MAAIHYQWSEIMSFLASSNLNYGCLNSMLCPYHNQYRLYPSKLIIPGDNKFHIPYAASSISIETERIY